MIPTAEQLNDIAGRSAGSLAEVSFGALLHALAVHERSLVLELVRRQVSKKIVLEAGVPVDCRSNLAHETLGRYLMTAGKLTELEFTTSLGRAAARGVPLGEILVEERLLTPIELWKQLQQNLAKKLLDLFSWRDGEFRILPDPLPPESSLKVKVPQLVVTGITRFAPQEQVNAAIGPLVGKRLALHPAPHFPLSEIRLSPRQTQLTDALEPRPRLDELAAATGLPYEEIARLLYALSILGVVVTADRLPAQAAPKPAPAPAAAPAPVPAPPAAPPAPSLAAPAAEMAAPPTAPAAAPADIERLANEITQTYLSYRKQDPFDLLAIPETATPAVIDERFLEFSAKYAPWKFSAPQLSSLEEKARDLFLAGCRAYGQLVDREQRETLIFRRRNLLEERARKPVSFAIKTDLLDPEVQYRKGLQASEAGKFKDAVQLLEFASDCDPQNGLYRAELAWARFRTSPPTAGRQALADLDEALRIDPKCGIACFYLGQIHGELGNVTEAEAHYQRAIKMMAPDRRPIDALKNLQSRKKR